MWTLDNYLNGLIFWEPPPILCTCEHLPLSQLSSRFCSSLDVWTNIHKLQFWTLANFNSFCLRLICNFHIIQSCYLLCTTSSKLMLWKVQINICSIICNIYFHPINLKLHVVYLALCQIYKKLINECNVQLTVRENICYYLAQYN